MTKFVFIVLGLLIFSMHANAQNDWKGSYSFDENGGKNAGGSVIFISHELNIFDGGDGLAATLPPAAGHPRHCHPAAGRRSERATPTDSDQLDP